MKLLRITALGLVFLIPFLSLGDVPSDEEVTKLLIGSWSVPKELLSKKYSEAGITFNSDGTFTSYLKNATSEADSVTVEGKWSVKRGILTEEITKSSNPKLIRVSETTGDKLINVTSEEYRYEGKKGVRWRVRKK